MEQKPPSHDQTDRKDDDKMENPIGLEVIHVKPGVPFRLPPLRSGVTMAIPTDKTGVYIAEHYRLDVEGVGTGAMVIYRDAGAFEHDYMDEHFTAVTHTPEEDLAEQIARVQGGDEREIDPSVLPVRFELIIDGLDQDTINQLSAEFIDLAQEDTDSSRAFVGDPIIKVPSPEGGEWVDELDMNEIGNLHFDMWMSPDRNEPGEVYYQTQQRLRALQFTINYAGAIGAVDGNS